MDFCYFIGIDIAKDTLDWAVYTQQGLQLSTHTPNTLTGIKTALAELKALPSWNPKQALFCMEHTGIYNAHLLELLHQQKLVIWLESSLQIKQAGGMQRGKTDKVDAQRIAQYAYRFRDQMRLWEPPRETIQKLAFLTGPPERCDPSTAQPGFQSVSRSSNRTGNVHQQILAKGPQRQCQKVFNCSQRRAKCRRETD